MLWETNLDETEQYLVKPMLALETVQITDWPGRCVDSSRSTTRERERDTKGVMNPNML